MTKPVTRKMAVDCLLHIVEEFEKENHITMGYLGNIIFCPECFAPLRPGEDIQFDHRHAIVHDGPHEYQNLRPVHAACHKKKTARDIAANAKVKRIIADKPSKRPMKSSGRKLPSRPFSKRACL